MMMVTGGSGKCTSTVIACIVVFSPLRDAPGRQLTPTSKRKEEDRVMECPVCKGFEKFSDGSPCYCVQEDGYDAPDACSGHPAGPYDPIGETVYCDGSCA